MTATALKVLCNRSINWAPPYDAATMLAHRATYEVLVQHPDASKVSALMREIERLCEAFVESEAEKG